MFKNNSSIKLIRGLAIFCLLAYTICFVVPLAVWAEETPKIGQGQTKEEGAGVKNDSQKSEVVYASLDGVGRVKDVYIVNSFSGNLSGQVDDFGKYSELEALSLNGSVQQGSGDLVKVQPVGKNFYYKGKLKETDLPWIITLSHKLNGKEVSPTEIGGADGDWQYSIEIKSNPAFDDQSEGNVWARNLMLQITCSLSDAVVSHLESEHGMIAEVGSNKLVTFICLPSTETKHFTIEGQVHDFSMPAIQIAASNFSMDNFQFNLPDLANNKELKALQDATKLLSDGSSSLFSGLNQLNQGAGQLQAGLSRVEGAGQELLKGGEGLAEGLNKYLSGVNRLASNGSELVTGAVKLNEAASSIQQGLAALALQGPELLAGSSAIQNGIAAVAAGLSPDKLATLGQVREKLQGLPGQLESFKEKFTQLYGGVGDLNMALDQLIQGLYSYQSHLTSAAAIRELGLEGTDLSTNPEALQVLGYLDKLGGQLSPMISTLEAIKSQLGAILDPSLQGVMLETLNQLGQLSQLSGLLDGLTELTNGIDQLNANYMQFHSGLSQYINGLMKINDGFYNTNSTENFYTGLARYLYGVNSYTDGANELNANSPQLLSGFGQYLDGTSQYVSGIQQWAGGYSGLSQGLSQVTSGAQELASGNERLHSETSMMDDKMADMIESALADYKGDEHIPSFASEKNQDPNHIQFVLVGEAITSPKEHKSETRPVEQSAPKDVWQRFLDLFN